MHYINIEAAENPANKKEYEENHTNDEEGICEEENIITNTSDRFVEDGLVAHDDEGLCDETKYAAKTSNDILNGVEGLCGEIKSNCDTKTSYNGSIENNNKQKYENKKKFHDEEESAMETSIKESVEYAPQNKNENKGKKSSDRSKYWKFQERAYTNSEIRMLVAEYLAILCKIIMSNQVYSFGGKIYLQSEHGSIGDEAVGMIAQLVMIWWSKRLKMKLKNLKIENPLMKIFLYDVNGVFSALPKGTQYVDGTLIINVEKAEEEKRYLMMKVL